MNLSKKSKKKFTALDEDAQGKSPVSKLSVFSLE